MTTYKVKVFSDNGTIIFDKTIRAKSINTSSSGVVYLKNDDDQEIFVGPTTNTVIEKA